MKEVTIKLIITIPDAEVDLIENTIMQTIYDEFIMDGFEDSFINHIAVEEIK